MSRRYDDGMVTICTVINTAEQGAMPQYRIQSVIGPEAFAEREIGINRAYLAKGADEQVDLLIQIWAHERRPRIGQIAVIHGWKYQENPEGDQYRIDNVQLTSEDGLPVFLLTLRRLEDNYDDIG